MRARVVKQVRFHASHVLPQHPGKCSRLHGHTYTVEVSVVGSIRAEDGMVVDFDTLEDALRREVIERFDHRHLNDLLENPTAELLAVEIYERLSSSLSSPSAEVERVVVHETPTTRAEFPVD